MLRIMRSEIIRLMRPSLIVGGIGSMAGASGVATLIGFAAAGKSGPGPGQYIPTEAALAAPDGYIAGLMLAANLIGIAALTVWAIATATDFSSGMVRLLAQAEPRRWRLIVGKVLALVLFTLVGALAATLAAAGTAAACAPAFGISTSAWADAVPTLLETFRNVALAATAWGAIGLLIALVTRSAGVAIAVGIGYLVVLENMIVAAISEPPKWLLGTTLTALAAGGTPAVPFETAAWQGLAYIVGCVLAAVAVTHFREITD
ncbi:MAG: hypothetical protein QMD96_01865 [Anaerosomatales bacterium]|nr:hypothetical protein [Anaerosomatales bacterium]